MKKKELHTGGQLMKMKSKNWTGGIPVSKDYVEVNFIRHIEDCDPQLRKVDTITFTLKQWAAFKLEMDHLLYYLHYN